MPNVDPHNAAMSERERPPVAVDRRVRPWVGRPATERVERRGAPDPWAHVRDRDSR